MMQSVFVEKLGLDLPVVQGPFGGGLSTIELTATVSNHGGLGSFGAHLLDGTEIEALSAALVAKTERSFAINLWVSDHDFGGDDMSEAVFDKAWTFYAPYFQEFGLVRPERPTTYHPRFHDQINALISARPAVFSFVFGIPSPAILQKCRLSGIVTIGAATTLAEVDALDAANVDVILTTGFEAGGHRPSFLDRAEDSLMGTLALSALGARRTKKPIIAAGGLADASGIRAVMSVGAQAAQLGTAFLACDESGATDLHRNMLFSARAEKTALTRSYTGRLARGIPNRVTAEFDKRSDALPPFPIHSWFVGHLKSAAIAANIDDFISLYAGQGAPLIKQHSASALLTSIRDEL
jgi:nitronate monooxygenase